MEPITVKINELFTPHSCVIIPRYQRRFSWTEENAHSLIRDVAEIATSPVGTDHWTGVIMYRQVLDAGRRCEIGRVKENHICREVIDGQQRLTTIMLWIKAILDTAEQQGAPIEYELSPFYPQTPNDSEFQAILDGVDVSRKSDLISRVYTYFRYLLWLGEEALVSPEVVEVPRGRLKSETAEGRWQEWIDKDKSGSRSRGAPTASLLPSLLRSTTSRLSFLGLRLSEADESERIFSALNGNRTELSQFDHTRNWVFNSIPEVSRDNLFDHHWKPAESAFETLQVRKRRNRDYLKSLFLYDYLISLGEGSQGQFNASRSFSAFLRFWRSGRSSHLYGSLDKWLKNNLQREIALWKVQREDFTDTLLPDGSLLSITTRSRRILHRIRRVSDGPPAPLVLWLLRRSLTASNDPEHLTALEIEQVLDRLEGYMFKTLLGGGSLTNMRSEVIGSMARIDKECRGSKPGEAVKPLLATIDRWTTVRWATLKPDLEAAHKRGLGQGVSDMLPTGATLALLDAVEEALAGRASKGFLPAKWEHKDDPYSVEHIFPQKGKKWTSDLKAWRVSESEMKCRLQVLGNLTALETTLNQELNNRVFKEKKHMVSENTAAAASKLQDWVTAARWSPSEIDARTTHLVMALKKFWPDPT